MLLTHIVTKNFRCTRDIFGVCPSALLPPPRGAPPLSDRKFHVFPEALKLKCVHPYDRPSPHGIAPLCFAFALREQFSFFASKSRSSAALNEVKMHPPLTGGSWQSKNQPQGFMTSYVGVQDFYRDEFMNLSTCSPCSMNCLPLFRRLARFARARRPQRISV